MKWREEYKEEKWIWEEFEEGVGLNEIKILILQELIKINYIVCKSSPYFNFLYEYKQDSLFIACCV